MSLTEPVRFNIMTLLLPALHAITIPITAGAPHTPHPSRAAGWLGQLSMSYWRKRAMPREYAWFLG